MPSKNVVSASIVPFAEGGWEDGRFRGVPPLDTSLYLAYFCFIST